MKKFVHLHVHTEYSLLDGANRIKDLIRHTKELGMDSIAITDHGAMFGVIDFYKEAVKNGIKPILGCEVYIARRTRHDKEFGKDSESGHLVLLAKNITGYKNLMKIVSIGFTEGFYYKPRVDIEVLEKYSEGIIALSACLAGNIARELLNGTLDKAKEEACLYNKIFGQDNFYLELQNHGIGEQLIVNQKLIKISKETGIPIIATNDAHYLRRQDKKAHEILLCIQTGKNIDDEDRMSFQGSEFYVKSPEEMHQLFCDVPEALENTLKIAERCNVEIEFNKLHLPKFDVPEEQEPFSYLKKLCYEGLYRLYKDSVIEERKTRLGYELEVIKKMGYVDYFLIVWDFIKYAKDNGIMVGPGRGSAAGSLVAYTLGITSVDPIKYNLIFERFLNPERISMPDIDIDFCYERRQEVIDYVIRKYGKDRVAQIITFGTMAARAVIRDVGRALNIPYADVDLVAKMIPFKIGMNIELALELNPDLKNIYEENGQIRELIDMAKLLEGMPRHSSTHAAGVVISKEPVVEYVPVSLSDESITTQFTMGLLEELGLLKMDFLGLRTLTVIKDAVELIKSLHNKDIDIGSLDFDDKLVYKMIGDGKTTGVFQLESTGMTQFMTELLPNCLEDIIAGISLYRPGPMDQIPRYIKNKNNPNDVKFLHESLESILDVTYGCMVYQEQVMQIVRELADYSMGNADLVRRAMSKKKADVMEKERQNFVGGALKKGIKTEISNQIFNEMMDFASYAFNKSHAAAYAVIAYQTAWLKFYYPLEFMAATLNSFVGNSDKVTHYIHECKKMNISVMQPDINESHVKFTVSGDKIRFGLAAIKNVGEAAVKVIIEERGINGYFKNFKDFCERMDNREINKKCIESLILGGAFDTFDIYRSKLAAVFEKIIDSISQVRKRNMVGQLSIFEVLDKVQETNVACDKDLDIYPDIDEFSKNDLLRMEKEMLGIYVSGHPLYEYENEIKSKINFFSKDLKNQQTEDGGEINLGGTKKGIKDGIVVTIGGIITSVKTKLTKNNSLMAFVTIEDLFGTIEVIVFSSAFNKYKSLLDEENVVLIKGKLSLKEDEKPKVMCEAVSSLKEQKNKKIYIKIEHGKKQDFKDSLDSLLKYFHGNTPVYIYSDSEKKLSVMEREFWVELNESLIYELKERLGDDNVKVV